VTVASALENQKALGHFHKPADLRFEGRYKEESSIRNMEDKRTMQGMVRLTNKLSKVFQVHSSAAVGR
jgi:hypothetical protein